MWADADNLNTLDSNVDVRGGWSTADTIYPELDAGIRASKTRTPLRSHSQFGLNADASEYSQPTPNPNNPATLTPDGVPGTQLKRVAHVFAPFKGNVIPMPVSGNVRKISAPRPNAQANAGEAAVEELYQETNVPTPQPSEQPSARSQQYGPVGQAPKQDTSPAGQIAAATNPLASFIIQNAFWMATVLFALMLLGD